MQISYSECWFVWAKYYQDKQKHEIIGQQEKQKQVFFPGKDNEQQVF